MINAETSWNLLKMQTTVLVSLEKMLQPIKGTFWEKWVWGFKTPSSTFYGK